MTWPVRGESVFSGTPDIAGRMSALVQRGCTVGTSCLIAPLFAPWVALTGSVRKFLLAIVLLDIPLEIDKSFAHLDDAGELGAVGGFNISVTTFALAALCAAWLIDRSIHRYRPARIPVGLVVPLALYMGVAALSVSVARDVGLSARALVLLVQMFLLYVYLVATVRTKEDAWFVVRWLLYGLVCEGVIIALSAAGEMLALPGLQARMVEDEFGTAARFAGTLGVPNITAGYLEMLLAPALAILGTTLGRLYKILAVLGLSLGAAALVGTFSRGGWLAGSFSLTIVYLLLWRRGRLSGAVPVVFLILLSVLALVFHESIGRRLTEDDRGSARSRVPLMMMALHIIEDQPALGVGVNNYTEALRPRTPEFGNEWLFTVHNQYLLVWTETGAIGLAAYLWFLLATLYWGWQRWKRTDPLLSALALGFTAALMGQMLHMNVDIFSSRPLVQLLVVVSALIGAMSRMDAPHASLGAMRVVGPQSPT